MEAIIKAALLSVPREAPQEVQEQSARRKQRTSDLGLKEAVGGGRETGSRGSRLCSHQTRSKILNARFSRAAYSATQGTHVGH